MPSQSPSFPASPNLVTVTFYLSGKPSRQGQHVSYAACGYLIKAAHNVQYMLLTPLSPSAAHFAPAKPPSGAFSARRTL